MTESNPPEQAPVTNVESTPEKGPSTTSAADDLSKVMGALKTSMPTKDSEATIPDIIDKPKDISPLPADIDTVKANALNRASEPSTPIPEQFSQRETVQGLDLPANRNMADYVTPPTPGEQPQPDPQFEVIQEKFFKKPVMHAEFEYSPNTLSPREQERQDESMLEGINALFNNRFNEAQSIFQSKAKDDPLYSLGLGAMALIQALSTSDAKDVETAIKKLTKTYEFASGQIEAAWAKKPLKDTVSHYFSNLMGTNTTGLPTNTSPLPSEALKKPDFLPNGALRAHVIRAECCLLMAILHLSQETVVGYLKTGLNLRRAYSSYSLVWQEYKRMGQEFNRYMDKDTISAIQFGIGSVHLLLSSLPPKILKIISAFGWNADKHLGFALLKLCMEGKRIRSPLASIMLLMYYVTLMSYCPTVMKRELMRPAIEILLSAQETYPNSALFLYYASRLSRLTKNLPLSTQSLNYAFEVSQEGAWAQASIGNLATYELAFNCIVGLDWATASLRAMELENKYGSRAFIKYFYGACMEQLGNRTEAILAFAEVPKLISTKRKAQMEGFLKSRIEFFEMSGYQDMDYSLPGFEILYLWNLFPCMKQQVLEQCLDQVDATLNIIYRQEKKEYEVRAVELAPDLAPPDYYDQRAVLLVIKSHILTCLNRSQEAIPHLNWIVDHKDRIKYSTWVVPYTYWESGIVSWYLDDAKRARGLWETALTHTGYQFEYRLAIQLNLAIHHAIELGVPEPDMKIPKGKTNHGRKRLPLANKNPNSELVE